MNYQIKHITNKEELTKALHFAAKIFDKEPDFGCSGFSEDEISKDGDLLVFTESQNEVIGLVFGKIEDNGNLTLAVAAVDEKFRKFGIAREMMLLVETRAKNRGINLIALGAVQSAEGFYTKLGYTGSLLIQSKNNSIDELLSLNTKYPVSFTNVYDGEINQVCLALPQADRELQRKYEDTFSECHTQMMFWKNI